LKRNLLLSILAVVLAALMPLAATCQVSPSGGAASAERPEIPSKYEVFAGYGYTSINQVNQSYHGLQGVNLSVTRDWGKYFGLTADGATYSYSLGSGNPGNPSVDMVLFGPMAHANITGRVSVFVHALLGGEHTGGESQTPKVSFAGGAGGGMDYKLSPHVSLRASGDDIASAFSVNNPAPGDSPHERRNSRAAFGVVYKF